MSVRPTRQQLEAARDSTISDVIAEGLDILFSGINPSLYSAAVGHHFARPGNRFWPALWRSGLTDRQLDPSEDSLLLDYGLGITNLVARATTAASELGAEELQRGSVLLQSTLDRYRPKVLAVLGLGAYRMAFDRRAELGAQSRAIAGVRVVVLPNPSGLQARYQLPELAVLFAGLRPYTRRAIPTGRLR